MERLFGTYSPYLYALLRIIAGLLFAMHGSQKLLGFPGDKDPVQLLSLMGLAGVIELVGGLLMALGLLTSIVAFIGSGQMAAGYFMVHAPQAALPILNGGETAVLLCFLFLYLAAQGSGVWSLDSLRNRRTPAQATHPSRPLT